MGAFCKVFKFKVKENLCWERKGFPSYDLYLLLRFFCTFLGNIHHQRNRCFSHRSTAKISDLYYICANLRFLRALIPCRYSRFAQNESELLILLLSRVSLKGSWCCFKSKTIFLIGYFFTLFTACAEQTKHTNIINGFVSFVCNLHHQRFINAAKQNHLYVSRETI